MTKRIARPAAHSGGQPIDTPLHLGAERRAWLLATFGKYQPVLKVLVDLAMDDQDLQERIRRELEKRG